MGLAMETADISGDSARTTFNGMGKVNNHWQGTIGRTVVSAPFRFVSTFHDGHRYKFSVGKYVTGLRRL